MLKERKRLKDVLRGMSFAQMAASSLLNHLLRHLDVVFVNTPPRKRATCAHSEAITQLLLLLQSPCQVFKPEVGISLPFSRKWMPLTLELQQRHQLATATLSQSLQAVIYVLVAAKLLLSPFKALWNQARSKWILDHSIHDPLVLQL